jgi:oligoribonuclease NrnB/cAMP/cGMP phosphodiesterase (DHH superfamily)
MTDQKQIVGIYHKDCTDGTGAAAVLLRKFPSIQLFPLRHKYSEAEIAPVKQAATGSEVYFVDCAIGIDEVLPLAAHVTVIDHHVSMKDKLNALAVEGRITYIFDNEKSGASLSWSYFFPDEPLPTIITHIEDADLWHWKYGTATKYVSNYLWPYMNEPGRMKALFSADIKRIKAEGEVISSFTDFHIADVTRNARAIHLHIGQYDVPAYNVTMFESAVGNRLARETGKAVGLYTIQGNQVEFSFRSEPSADPSALALATTLGGGGHRNAAGATILLEEFLKMIRI